MFDCHTSVRSSVHYRSKWRSARKCVLWCLCSGERGGRLARLGRLSSSCIISASNGCLLVFFSPSTSFMVLAVITAAHQVNAIESNPRDHFTLCCVSQHCCVILLTWITNTTCFDLLVGNVSAGKQKGRFVYVATKAASCLLFTLRKMSSACSNRGCIKS